ncbi:ankyrin repeat-containing domain, PGG domain protein [Tanacetum coccineum]|uniref:Ankyrin repeat-containing domain, PGG domain protein n=1 Tax=Tanacetum coccineum TaxID=301880 RepID=A0ABQ4YEN9_9ASTR
MDLLSQGTRDTRDEQIIRSLIQAGAVDTKKESLFGQITHNPKSKLALDLLKYDSKPKFPYRFKQDSKNNEDWLDKKRNTLMVVASLIATMAFQAGTNPPSGVWQDTSTDHRAGYYIMEYNHQNLYHVFLVSNTLGFVSTLSIILLLISGLPFLRHRVFLWILMVIMWIATASMSLTYLVWNRVGLDMVDDSSRGRTHHSAQENIVKATIYSGLITMVKLSFYTSKSRQARVDKQETASKSRQARDGKQESSSKSRQARVDKKETLEQRARTAIDEKHEEMHELERTEKKDKARALPSSSQKTQRL